jgi:polyisoprenoid-binding protein YceI
MATTTTPVLDGIYELDQTHSTVQFAVRHVGVSTFRASFDTIEARLVIDNGTPELEAGAVVESISVGDPPEFREHVVRGSDFFAADEHPRIRFRSTQIELAEDGTATVSGDLEIRGISQPVIAAGVLTPPTEDPFGGIRIGLHLDANLDRRQWGMDWQMPLPAGGDALGWEVEISAQLELTKNA